MGKKNGLVLAFVAAAGIAAVASKLLQMRNKDRTLRKLSAVFLAEKNYKEAIEILAKIKNKDKEIFFKIAECHEHLGNLTDALVFYGRCLQSTVYVDALTRRYGIERTMGLHRGAFKDAFILKLMDNSEEHWAMNSEALAAYSTRMALEHFSVGVPSDVNYEEFFETLDFIRDSEGPEILFLSSRKYAECLRVVSSRENPLQCFLCACFRMLSGDVTGALQDFSDEDYKYSRMMYLFLKSDKKNRHKLEYVLEHTEPKSILEKPDIKIQDPAKDQRLQRNTNNKNSISNKNNINNKNYIMNNKDSKNDKDIIIKRPDNRERYDALEDWENNMLDALTEEQDPTIQLYLAKILDNLDVERSRQLALVNKSLDIKKTAAAWNLKMILNIKEGRKEDAKRLIQEGIKLFSTDISMYCIAIEYLLSLGEIDASMKLLSDMIRIRENDPRVWLFRYLISKEEGAPELEYLNSGIRADPRYFKLYFYLGNHVLGSDLSLQAFTQALECARTFEEVYAAHQLLLVVEIQNELIREYPNLFEK
ncbi:hypothetical protein ENBRE01_1196 [Enteropsectra breve]|nr:hypothetical protein ENBRE01_1196 [Enteropsectra breve]